MEEYTRIWKQILEEISKKVSAVSYDMWFSKLEPLDVSFGKIILVTNLNSIKETLTKNSEYKDNILDSIKAIDNPMVTDFSIITEEEKEAYLSKLHTNNTVEEDSDFSGPKFIENYTFDNFVVGSCNNTARSAAFSVAQNPGNSFNPLFIYGGVGLGKTHMLHAIGNYILAHNKNANIIYSTTEQFVNDFIESMRNNKVSEIIPDNISPAISLGGLTFCSLYIS